jgi:hypothetical protein
VGKYSVHVMLIIRSEGGRSYLMVLVHKRLDYFHWHYPKGASHVIF